MFRLLHKIAVSGCGNVGTALLELLCEKRAELKEKYGFEFEVTLICDLFKGTVADKNGLDLNAVINSLHTTNSLAGLNKDVQGEFGELLDSAEVTMLCEATPTNVETGEPALSHIKAALSKGIDVSTTVKGPLSLAYDELAALAKQNGAQLQFEGVVMSGTPFITMLNHGLAGCRILKIEGIINGTTNFILSKMYSGASYEEAFNTAKELGYTETDPSGDIDAWDPAVKVVILTKMLYGKQISVSDVDRTGIANVTFEDMERAKEDGCTIKLIAGIENNHGDIKAYVAPKKIPMTHPLASINGAINAATVYTDNLGTTTIIGPGAGRRATGQAILLDLLTMAGKR